MFAITLIKKYRHDYQAHLERISDFLLPGENVWWSKTDNGVEFKDSNSEEDYHAEGPSLHHFRSSNLQLEKKMLKESWQACLKNGVALPHPKVCIYDSEGNPTGTLVNSQLSADNAEVTEASSVEIPQNLATAAEREPVVRIHHVRTWPLSSNLSNQSQFPMVSNQDEDIVYDTCNVNNYDEDTTTSKCLAQDQQQPENQSEPEVNLFPIAPHTESAHDGQPKTKNL